MTEQGKPSPDPSMIRAFPNERHDGNQQKAKRCSISELRCIINHTSRRLAYGSLVPGHCLVFEPKQDCRRQEGRRRGERISFVNCPIRSFLGAGCLFLDQSTLVGRFGGATPGTPASLLVSWTHQPGCRRRLFARRPRDRMADVLHCFQVHLALHIVTILAVTINLHITVLVWA